MAFQFADHSLGSLTRNFPQRLSLFPLDQWPLKWAAHYTLKSTQDNPLPEKKLDIFFWKIKKRRNEKWRKIKLISVSLYVRQPRITCSQVWSPEDWGASHISEGQSDSLACLFTFSLLPHVALYLALVKWIYRFHCLPSSDRVDERLKMFLAEKWSVRVMLVKQAHAKPRKQQSQCYYSWSMLLSALTWYRKRKSHRS